VVVAREISTSDVLGSRVRLLSPAGTVAGMLIVADMFDRETAGARTCRTQPTHNDVLCVANSSESPDLRLYRRLTRRNTVDLASLVPGIDEMGNLTKQAFVTPAMVVLVLLPRRNRSLATMDDDLELLGSGVDPIAEQFET